MKSRKQPPLSEWDARVNYAFCPPEARRRRGVDPITGPFVASAVVEALLAVGGSALSVSTFNAVAAALTNIIGIAAIAGGSALLSNALGPRQGQLRGPDAQRRTYDLEDGPRTIVLGRARVGGVFAFRASTGFDTYRLVAQCQGPVDGIEEYYVKDRPVVVEFDGAVSSPPYARASGSYLHFYSKNGALDQLAFDELISAFPDVWTEDHRLRGVAVTLAKYTSPGVTEPTFFKVWPESFQGFDTLRRGRLIYDPRKDSTTANGSGSHRTDDPDTWEWNDNGPLNVLWHCTASEDDGGFGQSFSQFDLDDIAEQADLADQLIDSKAGPLTERRSVCSGSYTTDTDRGVVLAQLLLSTGTRFVRLQNGLLSIRLDEDNPEPTASVDRDAVIAATIGGDEVVTDSNQLNILFVSPERNWQSAELEVQDKAWATDPDSIAATGRKVETLNLVFCPQSRQAQQIGRRYFSERRAMRGTVTANLSGLVSLGHVAGTVDLGMLKTGHVPKVKFGSHRFLGERDRVDIPIILAPELPEWSVEDDEAPAPVALEDIQYSGDIPAPEISRVVIAKYGAGATDIVLRVSYTSSAGATGYEASYRTWDGSISGPRLSMTELAGNWARSAADVTVGARFLLQARAFNGDGDVSNFSPAVDYTTAYDTAAPTGLSMLFSNDWDTLSESAFTATITYRVDDINVSQVKVERGNSASGPWFAVMASTYVQPYTDGTTTSAETGPITGIGASKTYWYRLTAYNSTGQSSTLVGSFILTG